MFSAQQEPSRSICPAWVTGGKLAGSSVSYTHLDVYKRQTCDNTGFGIIYLGRPSRLLRLWRIKSKTGNVFGWLCLMRQAYRYQTVSYTHLKMVEIYGLELGIFDMGWPSAAAVAYNTSVGVRWNILKIAITYQLIPKLKKEEWRLFLLFFWK